MNVSVTFRHMDTSESLRNHVVQKIEHIKKYLDDATQAHVVLDVEKDAHVADIQISGHGILMHGQESSSDMYNSIDRAVQKIETQVKRHHEKLVDHKSREGTH